MLNEARKIALLLARLLGLKVDGKFDEFNTAFDDAMLNEYNIETEKLLALTEDEFKAQVSAAEYSTEKLNGKSAVIYVCRSLSSRRRNGSITKKGDDHF